MPGARLKLHVISAGAAQSVVQQLADELAAEGGPEVVASFGAVGAQKRRVLDAGVVDIVVLTQAMVDELVSSGHVVPGSRMDLGSVCGGIAIPAGRPRPDVSAPEALAASLVAASAIFIPDPAIATAGMQFMSMCAKLGVLDVVVPKLKTFPNGYTAMTEMARAHAEAVIGCTQITEIRFVRGVELVAALPKHLQVPTVYSLGISTRAGAPEQAREFAARLAGPVAASRLAASGFGMA